jgi:hypothetical protein
VVISIPKKKSIEWLDELSTLKPGSYFTLSTDSGKDSVSEITILLLEDFREVFVFYNNKERDEEMERIKDTVRG